MSHVPSHFFLTFDMFSAFALQFMYQKQSILMLIQIFVQLYSICVTLKYKAIYGVCFIYM